MKKIVVFASGNGSNAENIFQFFENQSDIKIEMLFCNNIDAKVLSKAKKYNIESFLFSKNELNENVVLNKLKEIQPDLIVLAGFLLLIPKNLVQSFPNKIINVHPALLPSYGGKGMYGMNVHRAVFENKESKTGITFHYVNEHYDEGAIIQQFETSIIDCKSPEEIAKKIQVLEHENFPKIIKTILNS